MNRYCLDVSKLRFVLLLCAREFYTLRLKAKVFYTYITFLVCLQAESGDFKPAVHSLQSMKQRVATRFPNPIRSRMKALCSSTLAGTGAADDLAIRVQSMYARLAGKLKLEAQIDFLNTLRMWCPFYGCTFFEVQCQYDYSPLDSSSTPPVMTMNAAVGPRAISLMTTTDPPVIMRHPYKRIIKWIAHADKHIFTYWVIKTEVTLSDMEEHQQNHVGDGDFDARPYCDCVYLVSPQVKELEYLVQSYVACRRDVSPCLPGAPDELRDIPVIPAAGSGSGVNGNAGANADDPASNSKSPAKPPPPRPPSTPAAGGAAPPPPPPPPSAQKAQRRASRLGVFLSALGGNGAGTSGTGMVDGESEAEEVYGDDAAAVGNSLFKNMYKNNSGKKEGDADEDLNLNHIPAAIRYASTMSELQKVASETNFSDDEESEEEDEEEDTRAAKKAEKQHQNTGNKSSASPPPRPPPPPGRRPSMLAQASNMFFGSSNSNSKVEQDSDSDDEDNSGSAGKRKQTGNQKRRNDSDSD